MNIFKELKTDLESCCFKICPDLEIWASATLEAPKDPLNGDISTNIAMLIGSKNGENPREVAFKFKELLGGIEYIAHIEVAGPGFINFTIKAEKWHGAIRSVLCNDKDFWEVNIGKGEKVNVEYVSANPTGPIHIGHARGAVYGDALANILKKCGYSVTKEYYINDAGSQIDILVDSLLIRYKEALSGKKTNIPKGLYPGEYLATLGQKIALEYQDKLLKLEETTLLRKLKEIAISEMMVLIKSDLQKLGIKHDVFTSEQDLHDSGKIDEAVNILKEKALIYNGVIPSPRGKIHKNCKPKEQLLLRSSNYGDDQDRPIQKFDGSWSYLAADFAYAKDKIDRGFNCLVYILGADHSGYVKRIEAVIKALGDGKVKSDIRISQLVNFVNENDPIKMSKRSGNFMTVGEVVKDVGKDILRFIMLTRRNDMNLDFDFAKVKEQSKENPVFYVQYAHVRARSVLLKAQKNIPLAYKIFTNQEFNLSLLSSEEEIQLIKLIASWPKILLSAVTTREPQKIAYYLIDISSRFHSIWNLAKENNNYRFNVEDDKELTAARLAFAEAVKRVIVSGFQLIGITPLNTM